MKSSASSVITRAIDRWSMQRRIAGCIPPRVGGSKFAGNRTPDRNSLPRATTFAQRKGHKAIANGQEELKRSHEFCGYSHWMGARCRVAPCRRAHALADARLIEACTREIRWIWKATAETQRYARPSDFLLKLFEAFEARYTKQLRRGSRLLSTHEGNVSCRSLFATTTSIRRSGCSRKRCSGKACFAR